MNRPDDYRLPARFHRVVFELLADLGGDEVVKLLAETIDDYRHHIIRREGAEGRAAALGVISDYLKGLDASLEEAAHGRG